MCAMLLAGAASARDYKSVRTSSGYDTMQQERLTRGMPPVAAATRAELANTARRSQRRLAHPFMIGRSCSASSLPRLARSSSLVFKRKRLSACSRRCGACVSNLTLRDPAGLAAETP